MCIDALLKTGLCFSYDPTNLDVSTVKKIQLSPSGLLHFLWGTWDETYIGSMLQVTPISDEEIHGKLMALIKDTNPKKWDQSVALFLNYLIKGDNLYSKELDHPAYKGQKKLIGALYKKSKMLSGY